MEGLWKNYGESVEKQRFDFVYAIVSIKSPGWIKKSWA